jgi:hypothetical protein
MPKTKLGPLSSNLKQFLDEDLATTDAICWLSLEREGKDFASM